MKYKFAYIFILIVWSLAFSVLSPVYAVDIKGLYEVEVPVFSQTENERKAAMRRGMLQVLIKISGSSEIPFAPGIPKILENAASYVQQFRYSAWPASRPVPHAFEGGKTPNKILWVRYDKQALNEILRNRGLPIWGRSRPVVLIWLAVEDGSERYLLGNDTSEEMKRLFDVESKRRGMPILLPLLDLQDQVAIRVLDVWGDFQEEILQASVRYQTKAVLRGRLFRDGYEGWLAKWTLYEDGERVHWESRGASQGVIFGDAIDNVASRLSARYAQVINEAGSDAFFISVNNVTNLKDYARIVKYLSSLALVTDASAVQFDADTARFRIDIDGAEQGVVRTIELGNVLVAVSDSEGQEQVDQEGAQTGLNVNIDTGNPIGKYRVYRLLR